MKKPPLRAAFIFILELLFEDVARKLDSDVLIYFMDSLERPSCSLERR